MREETRLEWLWRMMGWHQDWSIVCDAYVREELAKGRTREEIVAEFRALGRSTEGA